MLNKLILLSLSVLLMTSAMNAQTVILPANTINIQNDTTIVLTPGGGIDKNYHICADVDVVFTGLSTYMMRFYLESYATVALADTFSFYVVGDVFMKENSIFDFNHKSGSNIDTALFDLPCSLIDTGTSVFNPIAATNLIFDYSLLPNGQNPCAAPSNINNTQAEAGIRIQNPVSDVLNIQINTSDPNYTIALYNAMGQLISRNKITSSLTQIPMADLQTGIIPILFQTKEKQSDAANY